MKTKVFDDTVEIASVIWALVDATGVVAFDVETTGLDPERDAIHGIALANKEHAWYLTGPAYHVARPYLCDLARRDDLLWVAHNAKFDLRFLVRDGFRPKNLADTMIAAYLLDENRSLKLKELAQTVLGIRERLPEFKDLQREYKTVLGLKRMEQVTINDIPLDVLGDYAARDARLTWDLWSVLKPQLEEHGFIEMFWEKEMPFIWALWRMEDHGLPLDLRKLDELKGKYAQKADNALLRWRDIAGDVNHNSNPQLQEYIYKTLGHKVTKKTKKGAPSVDVQALNRLLPHDKNRAVATLLEIRKAEKIMGTYLENYDVMQFDGRLHGTFNRIGTVTGRLSSSNPNLQNIPSHGETGKDLRSLIAAPPGYKLICCDYSQIELRLTAHYSRDPHLVKVFQENGDPHQMTADKLDIERRFAKSVNFGWVYGIGPRGLADSIERAGNPRPKETDTKQWLRQFDRSYPTLVAWKRKVLSHARRLGGKVRTIGGRWRRLPDLLSIVDSARYRAERQAVNSIIQGSAADIIQYAMLELDKVLDQYGAVMLAQVHDELLFMCPENQADRFAAVVQEIMESVGPVFNIRVPIIAEPAIGISWAEVK